ncbi:MAG: alanine--tRNA ligase [Candidatus Omnitrophica bacterium]|nr:alanine--tRNA ligase [Candidatus Omnitrophota bacterium]
MTHNELRTKFLAFFESKKHKVLPSDSLVPADDPTLLFTGAGMNQFKEQFIGRNIKHPRVATSQKCLRTPDLERVGRTACHHTFFEMLGNFSFGDYFKKEAIEWSWEFLTDILKISKNKLWVSVYKDDKEAYGIWKDLIKVPDSKIMKFGDDQNFWPANTKTEGPNGPCGPCSEIFYDQGVDVGCQKSNCDPSCECDRYIEVWNLVFTQFERVGVNKLKPLKNKNIDTGMGLERLAAVMQGASTNFETDIFTPIIDAVKSEVKEASGGRFKFDKVARQHINAIADHLRASTFLVADGVFPSNEERGYVQRMLIRRAFRYGRQLGIEKPFLYKLVAIVAKVMGEAYPEILMHREDIAQVILSEEERFQNTLMEGTQVLENLMAKADKVSKKSLAGDDIFRLYDTYGFPIELVSEIAAESGFKIDRAGFKKRMEAQRALSRKGSQIKDGIFAGLSTKELADIKKTEFIGYEKLKGEGKIVALLLDNKKVSKVSGSKEVEVVLDKTPFYGESGGQVADKGEIIAGSTKLEVTDVKRADGVFVHIGMLKKGELEVGQKVRSSVDEKRRSAIARAHTATHLLHWALRKVLGAHAKQCGSLVEVDRFRFDFTHFKKVERDEIARIEKLVNERIAENEKVAVASIKLKEAKREGAIALFGEKYTEDVRMVSAGDFSKELCGGTHLDLTGKVKCFRITSESSIASGTRRIEAVTGSVASNIISEEEALLADLCKLLGVPKDNVAEAIEAMEKELKMLEKERVKSKAASSLSQLDEIVDGVIDINGVKVVAKKIEDADMSILRALTDELKKRLSPCVIVLGSDGGGRVALCASVSKDAVTKGVNAGAIMKEAAQIVGGGGGGRPDFATAGGKDPKRLNDALKKAYEIAEKILS